MNLNLREQFAYSLPENWTDYLFGQTNLESFRFYPLILGFLGIVFLIAVAVLIAARMKRKNRPLSSYLKLIGKVAFGELLLGLSIVFCRWQTLGFFSMRIFLLVWLISLPIATAVMLIVYLRKFSGKVHEAKEKVSLTKYLPGKK